MKQKRGILQFDDETRRKIQKMGGLATSKNRNHMAEIGKKGGLKISRDREYMAMIGQKGGRNSRKNKPSMAKNKI